MTRRWRSALCPGIVVGLLLLALLSLGQRYCTSPFAFNSDDLLPIHVGLDVLGRGHELQQYHLPGAPYIFPDLLLVLGCVALGKGLLTIFLIYNILYYGLLLVILTALFRQTGLRLREAFLFAGSGLLLFLVTHLGDRYQWRVALLYRPMNHAGVILAGLFLSLLVVRNLHRRMPWLVVAAFVVAGGLGLFSDRLLLPQFLAPLCLTAVLLAAFRVVPVRKAVGSVLLTGGAYALCVGLERVFSHYFVLLPQGVTVRPSEMRESWIGFIENLPLYLQGQHFLKILFLSFLPAAAVVALRAVWAARGKRLAPASPDEASRRQAAVAAIALIGLLCCVCNVGAVVVSGAARLPGFDRYLLGAVFIPFLCAGFCCRFLPGWPLQWLARACPVLVVLYATAALGIDYRQVFTFGELRPPYPEVARVLDRLAREQKLGHGLATFWNSRSLCYLTHEYVQLHTILPNGEPWLHVQTPYAYLTPGRRAMELPHYNFILVNDHDPDPGHSMDRVYFERRFGTPREKVQAGPCEVWIYDGLLNTELNLFLRSILASRCRNVRPYFGPASPAALAVPKENGSSFLRPGTVMLPPDGEVKLTFSGSVKGEMIDVTAQYDAHFDLLFYQGDELVATLYVPRVNVPQVSASYRMAGNQSRLLTLPPALAERSWTSVLVRSKGGPGCFALGHFLVYPKAPPHLKTRQTPVGGHWHYEAEIQPGSGAVVQDRQASGGRARMVPREVSGVVLSGPNVFLEQGRYRVDFFLKTAARGSGPLAQIEVAAGPDGPVLTQRKLAAVDFAETNGYQKFSLILQTEVELSDCQFRVVSDGKAQLFVDRVELVCEE